MERNIVWDFYCELGRKRVSPQRKQEVCDHGELTRIGAPVSAQTLILV